VGRDAYVDDLLGGYMTDQEIITMVGQYGYWVNDEVLQINDIGVLEFARAIEQAEKQDVDWEAVAADQAMTIAMMKSEYVKFQDFVTHLQKLEKQACEIIRREWVGLTDDEITELFCNYDDSQFPKLARAIEAKLKDKNTSTPKLPPKLPPKQCTDLCGND